MRIALHLLATSAAFLLAVLPAAYADGPTDTSLNPEYQGGDPSLAGSARFSPKAATAGVAVPSPSGTVSQSMASASGCTGGNTCAVPSPARGAKASATGGTQTASWPHAQALAAE
jgi:hypothetical protein